MKKIACFILFMSIFLTCALAVPEIPAETAVLMERDTGKILYEKDSHKQLAPASVTKVMTLLLVMEALESGKISFEDTVTVSAHAAGMGGSQVYLEEGEQMPLEDMLKATVVSSGNDSAVALAEHVAGSEESFVVLMNERAKELNMNDTHFVNCTGLDADGHLTSANDIAIMSCELLKHNKIKEYTTIWMDTIRNGEFQLANTNKLIKTYSGITGLKTGSTGNAKYCMAASAQRDGMELVAAVMAAPSTAERFSSAATLLDYGFANFALFDGGKDYVEKKVPVILGVNSEVPAILSSDAKMLVDKGEISSLTVREELCNDVKAPVKVGQKLGVLQICKDDEILSEIPIVAGCDVNKLSISNIFWRIMCRAFMR